MQNPKWFSEKWTKIHYRVQKLQKRIATAYLQGDYKRLQQLQMMVLASYYCRLVSVRRVTSKKNRRTAGIDGKFWKTDDERYAAIDKLRNYQTYKPMPFKRIDIPKDHDKSKKRPLSVPTIYDRAFEGGVLTAIEPVVECTAGKHDYGSRKYHSNQDTIRDIYYSFNLTSDCPYILKTDIDKCFDHVSHEWLLQHAPIKKSILKTILKCKYVYNGKTGIMTEGVPQGGVLSPSLVNHALNGFEKVLNDKYGENTIHMVRFVDDFLFSAGSPKVLKNVLETLKEWLKERGMSLSEEKTKICHIKDGVDYIGEKLIVYNNTLWIYPNEQAIREKRTKLTHLFQQCENITARKLIFKLNDSIRGWGQHFSYLCPIEFLQDMDDFVQELLWEWALHKLKGNKPQWIYRHYWKYNERTGYRVFSSGDAILLRFIDQQPRVRYNFDLTKNPFLELNYFRSTLRGKEIKKHTNFPEELK